MATPAKDREVKNDRNTNPDHGERGSSVPYDLPDNEKDNAKLQPEDSIINLPDVSDIPGQENVTVPRMESFMDVTASSADEEGDSIFGTEDFNDTSAHTSMGQDETDQDEAVSGTP